MADLPERIFGNSAGANPVWHALETTHRHLAISCGAARRYPPNVTPFAAVKEPSEGALTELASLLEPDESVWIIGARYPSVPELSFEGTLPCLQMVLDRPLDVTSSTGEEIARMSEAEAGDMVSLTDLAFPGFFRVRTCEMGDYYGARSGGQLIAMGGERLKPEGYSEISGVCTHPSHRGGGLARRIIAQLTEDHRGAGVVSWLQVGSANVRAIELYRRLGFRAVREVTLHRICLAHLTL